MSDKKGKIADKYKKLASNKTAASKRAGRVRRTP